MTGLHTCSDAASSVFKPLVLLNLSNLADTPRFVYPAVKWIVSRDPGAGCRIYAEDPQCRRDLVDQQSGLFSSRGASPGWHLRSHLMKQDLSILRTSTARTIMPARNKRSTARLDCAPVTIVLGLGGRARSAAKSRQSETPSSISLRARRGPHPPEESKVEACPVG